MDIGPIIILIKELANDRYFTIFIITFFIGVLKAGIDLANRGLYKSLLESMLVAALMTIFGRSFKIIEDNIQFEAVLLLAATGGYLGLKHTDLIIKAAFRTLLSPLEKIFANKISDALKEKKDNEK